MKEEQEPTRAEIFLGSRIINVTKIENLYQLIIDGMIDSSDRNGDIRKTATFYAERLRSYDISYCLLTNGQRINISSGESEEIPSIRDRDLVEFLSVFQKRFNELV
jgi:hypothetical protein